MNRNVARFCLGELLNRLGGNLTLYGGMLYLAFYSDKKIWLALLIGSNVIATLLSTQLKEFVKVELLSKNLKRLLTIQFVCMFILFLISDNLLLFIALFFLKSACRVIYGGLIQSALPLISENQDHIFSANKLLSAVQSITFIASIGLSGALLELISLKGLFFIDALFSFLPLVLFRWFFPIRNANQGELKKITLDQAMSFLELMRTYPVLQYIFVGTFSLYLIAGGGTIIELMYYKRALNLSPIGISALMFLSTIGHLVGSILPNKRIMEISPNRSPVFIAVTMNLVLLTIFFHSTLSLIGLALFIYGFFNGIFCFVTRQMTYNLLEPSHQALAFLYQSFINNLSQLLSLFIVGAIGTNMADHFIMTWLVLISIIAGLMTNIMKYSMFRLKRIEKSW